MSLWRTVHLLLRILLSSKGKKKFWWYLLIVLNIDEEEHTATLGCCGRFLIKTEGDDGTLENFLSQAMEFSEQCFFSAHNDLIKINFIFNLYEKEKIADHSKEIEALKKQLEDNQEKVREYLLEEMVDEYRK